MPFNQTTRLTDTNLSQTKKASTRSPFSVWYRFSVAASLLSSLYVASTSAFGFFAGSNNILTATLITSLIASLAIGELMRQRTRERLESQQALQDTFDAMPIGLFTLDTSGNFVTTNPAFRRMLGHEEFNQKRLNWQSHFTQDKWVKLLNSVQQSDHADVEITHQSKSGGLVRKSCFLVKATLSRDRIEGSLQNVTERAKATAELEFLASNDPLTKVFNRRGIEGVLDTAMKSLAENKPLALAYLDLDRFKLINDLYGHNAGDDVLQQVCRRIEASIPGHVRLGRLGGDVFVLVIHETNIKAAEVICRCIVDSVCTVPFKVGPRAFQVICSIGLIEVNDNMLVKDAVSAADRACREAKAANSGGLVIYEKNARAFQQHEAEINLLALLSSSTATDGLFLVMQPIMSLSAPHDSLNFEVLLRMRDHTGALIPTDKLIKAGENSGRMSVIDRWVLSTTLTWLNQHYGAMRHTKFLCINLSGASLNDENFMQEAYRMLESNSHIAHHICLEITESVALNDLSNTRRFVDKVRSYGVKVALDDFGAGYTSFTYLKDITSDFLKIDGSFIVDMNKHPANIAIVEAIVSLARNLGMKTIAEWTEDAATVETLAEIGVDYVQGYIVARPQLPEDLLTATSSASFIVDKAMSDFAVQLGKARAKNDSAVTSLPPGSAIFH